MAVDPTTGRLINKKKLKELRRQLGKTAIPDKPLRYSMKQIAEALRKSGGFKSRACKILGCTWETLNRYFERWPQLHKVLEETDNQYLDMAEYSLLKQVKKENTQATLFYLERKGKGRGYAAPRDSQAAQQFNQFNLGIPGGGTWLDLMNKAHAELQAKGESQFIDLAPPKPKQLVEVNAVEKQEDKE